MGAWPVKDFSGNPIGVVMMTRDISTENAALVAIKADGKKTLSQAMVGVGLATLLAMALIGVLMYGIVRKINLTLERLIQNLSAGGAQITQASEQVAGSSTQLAESSGTAAANLEETSSALAEISAMTNKNSETADQGNAASSEEIASAGEELSAQAKELNQMVSILVELVTGQKKSGSRPRAEIPTVTPVKTGGTST